MKLACLVVLLPALPALPQGRPEYEVASLKPNASGRPGFSIQALPGGVLRASNISLKRLIAMAYSVTDYQIFGSLPWLESERYDVEAKAGKPVPLTDLRVMMQSLLDERFHLKFHRESREMQRYTLTLLKKGAPGLVEAPNGDCASTSSPQAASTAGTGCGLVNLFPDRLSGNRGRISQLADRLSTRLGLTVVDKTDLTGWYDMTMTWTPDPEIEQLPQGFPPPAGGSNGPSLLTAIQQQLGLKLTGGKGPVEVIVVDSAEKAASN